MHFVEDGGADSSRFEEHILGHGVGLGLLKCVTHVEQLHEERLLLWRTLHGLESRFEARRGLNFRSRRGSRSIRSGRNTLSILSIRRTRSSRRWRVFDARQGDLHHGAHLGLEVLADGSLFSFFGFEFAGQSGLHHISDGAHVIVGYPLPKGVLRMSDDGPLIENLLDGLQLVFGLRAVRRKAHDDAGVGVIAAKRCQYALTNLHHLFQLVGDDVGECLVQWNR